MIGLVSRLARWLNWGRRDWSTERDRAFHDALFTGQTHDPFTPSYPGNLTIRRFADLAAPHIHSGDDVLDLGCGPGEITCELARRFPNSRFVGIDHSAEALSRGQQLAKQLGLTNIRFEQQNLESYGPGARVGLVTMFDAFHHVLDPAAFIARFGRSCGRFFLIEPAGNRIGQWQRTLDLDWLAEAMFAIRDRLEYQFSLSPPARADRSAISPPEGEPTERRYSLDDVYAHFSGYGVEVRGTVAGLERYGTLPGTTSGLRDGIGDALYGLMAELDDLLLRQNVDLCAKHWAIYAERGREVPKRTVPAMNRREVEQPLPGPYDAAYGVFQGPVEASAGSIVLGNLTLTNRSWRVWDSAVETSPILISYHWLDEGGRTIVDDGLRSRLPRPVAPGETVAAAIRIECPDTAGRRILALDLVHEGVTWFSAAGVPPLRVPFLVT